MPKIGSKNQALMVSRTVGLLGNQCKPGECRGVSDVAAGPEVRQNDCAGGKTSLRAPDCDDTEGPRKRF